MKWGTSYEQKWGWIYGPDSIPTTVEVMIVRGKFKPGDRIRDYYQCEDYVSRHAKNTAAWDKKI
jgi:DNA-binding transcriptional regulator GbsR (MarR family)